MGHTAIWSPCICKTFTQRFLHHLVRVNNAGRRTWCVGKDNIAYGKSGFHSDGVGGDKCTIYVSPFCKLLVPMASAKLEIIAEKRDTSGARRVPFLLAAKGVVYSVDDDGGYDDDGCKCG